MAKDNNYTSDAMNFIKDFLKKNPNVKEKQADLRSTWWDINDTQVTNERNLDTNNLKTEGYTYFSYTKAK